MLSYCTTIATLTDRHLRQEISGLLGKVRSTDCVLLSYRCKYQNLELNCCCVQETWQAMEECVDAGLAKAIGISNFTVKKMQELLEFAVKPVTVN